MHRTVLQNCRTYSSKGRSDMVRVQAQARRMIGLVRRQQHLQETDPDTEQLIELPFVCRWEKGVFARASHSSAPKSSRQYDAYRNIASSCASVMVETASSCASARRQQYGTKCTVTSERDKIESTKFILPTRS
ncbi:hypothetical protein U9M48_015687, partial [Paspalum notatum var. saurae]